MKRILFLTVICFTFVAFSCNKEMKPVEREVAVIETDYGNITIDFFENVAPVHVSTLKKLISEKFYDGLYFHRVIPNFVIQGGDPNTRDDIRENDGMGQDDQPMIKAEFSRILHKRGILSMARKAGDINSATSQFFICVDDAPSLDKQYTVFGKVVDGMDAVDKIVKLKRDKNDNPLQPAYMKKVYLKKMMIIPSPENEK
jgi:cyclophilin family peptidyl-prolyl cis-trans isomerase